MSLYVQTSRDDLEENDRGFHIRNANETITVECPVRSRARYSRKCFLHGMSGRS